MIATFLLKINGLALKPGAQSAARLKRKILKELPSWLNEVFIKMGVYARGRFCSSRLRTEPRIGEQIRTQIWQIAPSLRGTMA